MKGNLSIPEFHTSEEALNSGDNYKQKIKQLKQELEFYKKKFLDPQLKRSSKGEESDTGPVEAGSDSNKIVSAGRFSTVNIGCLTEDDYVILDDYNQAVALSEKIRAEFEEFREKTSKERDDLQNVNMNLTGLIEKINSEKVVFRNSGDLVDETNKELKSKNKESSFKDESHTNEIKNLKTANQSIRSELSVLTQRVKELEELNETLQKEQEDLEAKNTKYKREMLAVKTLSQENQELALKVAQLEELEENRDVIVGENLKELLENKTKRLAKLESELSKMLKESKIQAKKIADLKSQSTSLKENYDELMEKYTSNQAIGAAQRNVIASLQNQIKELMLQGNDNPLRSPTRAISNITPMEMKKMSMYSSKNNFKIEMPKTNDFSRSRVVPSLRDLKATIESEELIRGREGSASNLGRSDSQNTNNLKSTGRRKFEDLVDMNRSLNSDERRAYEKYIEQMKNEGNEAPETKNERNSYEIDKVNKAVLEYLRQQEAQTANFTKVTMNHSCQTDYFSIVDYIIDNEDEIRNNENDFEKIKEAVDVLADMIGFNGVEDYVKSSEPFQADEQEEPVPQISKNGHPRRPSYPSKSKEPTSFVGKKNVKVITSKAMKLKKNIKEAKPNVDQNSKENGPVMRLFAEENREEFKKPFKIIPKKPIPRIHIERDENVHELSDDQDHVVQKSKIIRNADNKHETIEVIEYIRVPKELSISKPTLPSANTMNNFTENEIKEINRIANHSAVSVNTYESEMLDREKLYFRIYINIKQRYQTKPEKFLKIFKLTFNKVPEFAGRLDESYNPKTFLFNFEEFKNYFTQILHSHQYCGRHCVHFSRFYQKLGIIQSQNNYHKLTSQYIDRLPHLLTDQIKN